MLPEAASLLAKMEVRVGTSSTPHTLGSSPTLVLNFNGHDLRTP